MTNLLKNLHFTHTLALIPLGATVVRALQAQTMYVNFFAALALLCLYVLVLVLAGRLKNGFWTGYIALAAYVAWLAGGLLLALLIVVVGTAFAIPIYWRFVEKQSLSSVCLAEFLGRIAITGNGILVAHGVYVAFMGQIPFVDARFQQLLPLIAALVAGYLVMQIIGVTITNVNPVQRLKNVGRGLLLEPLLVMVTIVLPLIEVNIGTFAFIIMIALTGAQALRHHQGRESHETLMRRLKEMSLLNTLGQTIASNLDLGEVLDNIYREIHNLTNATTFFVALYNNDHQTVEYPLAFFDGQLQQLPTRRKSNQLTDYIISTRKTVFLDVYDSDQLQQLDIDDSSLKARVYIGVPLIVAEKVIGAIIVAHDDDPHALTERDVELIQTVASQASLALRNATLYDRTVTLAHDLALINQSLQDIMFNLDRDDAMRTACQIAVQVTHAQKAAFFLLQQNQNHRLELVQSLGFGEGELQLTSLPYQPHLFRDGPRIITNIAESDDQVLKQHAQDAGFQSLVQIPLRSGMTIVGCLCVYHQNIHFHEMPEINLLMMLANQITAALDNADLLQALELYAAEQGQLVHLSRISTVNLDLESIIYDICEMMAQMMDLPHTAIGLQNSDIEHITIYSPTQEGFLTKLDIPQATIPEFEHALKPGSKSATYYASNISHASVLQSLNNNQKYETIAVLPLRVNLKTIGFILLGDVRRREFTDNDHRLLEMATHQIAIHIQNARTHTLTQENLLKRLEELSLLEESAQQVSQALDIDRLIENLLVSAMRATQAEFAALALSDDDNFPQFDIIIKEKVGVQSQRKHIKRVLKQGVITSVFKTGEAIIIDDNGTSDIYYKSPEIEGTYCSSLAVPLLRGRQVIGVLDIESSQPNFFSPEHTAFIKSLAGHAAVSLNNANLLKELNTNNEQMRAILDSTRDGIILLDHDGRILDANAAAEQLLHIPLRQHLEMTLPAAIKAYPESERLFAPLSKAYEDRPENLHDYEYSVTDEQNTDEHNSEKISVIKTFVIQVNDSNHHPGHMLLLRDITEEKELEELRETNQSMVIHDLLGPVTSMISNLSWAIDLTKYPGEKPIEESILPTLQSSVNSAEQLMSLVQTLRDIPMITQMELQPDPIAVQELAQNAYELLSGFIRYGNITLEFDIPDGLMVAVDNALMQRVFGNLLHNAAKFTAEDSKILFIADDETDDAGFVRVRICDSGVGIPLEHRERIFERFVQIEGQRPRDGGKGSGLGLNFCKLVIEAHGGSIRVSDDNPLSGACFAFTLPTRLPGAEADKA